MTHQTVHISNSQLQTSETNPFYSPHNPHANNTLSFTLIGAGNVATHLGKALVEAGAEAIEVYSRTMASAEKLAQLIHAKAQNDINKVNKQSQLYILAISDSALTYIIPDICKDRQKSLFLHTAGSVPMKVFEGYAQHYGVLYPLQTLSKAKHLPINNIPFLVEADSNENMKYIIHLAKQIGAKMVVEADSQQRMSAHLAAVFANNFSNHCFAIAQQIIEKKGFNLQLIIPIINETTAKLKTLTPMQAQTGPALRHDEITINKHLNILEEQSDLQEIYRIMTKHIKEGN